MLTLVTHTRNERNELLTKCVSSIEQGLVEGITHSIIECFDNWAEARLAATKLDEYVAFVDDDDTVVSEVLEKCLSVAKQTKAGVIVTSERRVWLDGRVRENLSTKTYTSLTGHPHGAHHLCLIRKECVDVRALDMHHQFGMGIDWFLKASAALRGGIIHIPLIGYNWLQHEGSMMRVESKNFARQQLDMQHAIRNTWGYPSGNIPVWQL